MVPLLKYSLNEAREEGLKKGIKQGRQEGRQEGQKELIAKLLESGVDLQVLCKGTGLSEEEIENLKNGN